jgi:hypothetical protein
MSSWFSVRCHFRWSAEWKGEPYEERITIWIADSADQAIALAEAEAHEYAESCGLEYLGLAQSYLIGNLDEGLGTGTEVYSLLRDSGLEPDDDLDQFFDTGREHEGPMAGDDRG